MVSRGRAMTVGLGLVLLTAGAAGYLLSDRGEVRPIIETVRAEAGSLLSGLGELRPIVETTVRAGAESLFPQQSEVRPITDRAEPPATICVLSGDVHHAYLAVAHDPKATTSRIYQITCSPIHNTIPRAMKLVFHFGWSKTFEVVMKAISRLSGVPPLPIYWTHPSGPHFGNQLALLTFEGREARVRLERTVRPDAGARDTGKSGATGPADADPFDPDAPRLEVVVEHDLTGPTPP